MCRHQFGLKQENTGGNECPHMSSARPLSNSQRICKVILELIDTERLYVRVSIRMICIHFFTTRVYVHRASTEGTLKPSHKQINIQKISPLRQKCSLWWRQRLLWRQRGRLLWRQGGRLW